MRLGWNVSNIKEKMANLDCNTQNLERFIYTNMLNDINVLNDVKVDKIDKKLFFEVYNKMDFKYFQTPVFKVLSYLSSNIKKINYKDEEQNKYQEEKIIMKICHSFYKKKNKDSFSNFKKIISLSNRIHFSQKINKNILGRTYIISPNDFYCLINSKDYLQACLTTIHEFKHIENVIKGYDKGFYLYQELPSILYEFYMLDYLDLEEELDVVNNLRYKNINKYINILNDLIFKIEILEKMHSDEVFLSNIYQNYDLYYEQLNLREIYYILKNGCSKTISQLISFLVAIDIYVNSNLENASNAISGYIFGIYKMNPIVVDNVIEYVESLNNKQKNKEKIKK